MRKSTIRCAPQRARSRRRKSGIAALRAASAFTGMHIGPTIRIATAIPIITRRDHFCSLKHLTGQGLQLGSDQPRRGMSEPISRDRRGSEGQMTELEPTPAARPAPRELWSPASSLACTLKRARCRTSRGDAVIALDAGLQTLIHYGSIVAP